MKKKQTLWLVIMLCWWGFLFPELTFTEDSLRVVLAESENNMEVRELEEQLSKDQWEKYVDFLGAQPEQVKVKSKVWELIKNLWD